jgi:gluconolactonase
MKFRFALAALAAATVPALAAEPAPVAAIPGVVAAGARLEVVVSTLSGMDGVVGLPDGSALYAQEHTSTVHMVDPRGTDTVFATDTHGAGSLGMDRQGRVWAVQRTCTDAGVKRAAPCTDPTRVGIVGPGARTVADHFADGKPFGRPADLVVDARGGAYFTMGGVYYVAPDGKVVTVADQDIRANGLALSPDEKTLYATNGKEIVAFDVTPGAAGTNRRVFSDLEGDMNADGMAVDAAGRVYATGASGVHVLAPDGKPLGLIPTARRPTSIAFGGPGKKTLFVVTAGAAGLTGPENGPNGARTLYRIALQAAGYAGRPK